jgi:hypothetical protein
VDEEGEGDEEVEEEGEESQESEQGRPNFFMGMKKKIFSWFGLGKRAVEPETEDSPDIGGEGPEQEIDPSFHSEP